MKAAVLEHGLALLRELDERKQAIARRERRERDAKEIRRDVRGIFCEAARIPGAHGRNSGKFTKWV